MKAKLENNGKIKVYAKLPSKYKSATLNIAGGFHQLSDADHEAEGFYNLIKPTKTVYQRYGTITFDNTSSTFVYGVVDFTAQEVIDYDEEEADTLAEFILSKYENDGLKFSKKYRQLVKRGFDNGRINKNQYKRVRSESRPAISAIKEGDWEVAQDEASVLSSANEQITIIYDRLKNKIDNYIINNNI